MQPRCDICWVIGATMIAVALLAIMAWVRGDLFVQ
jgi:hypothetical protein